MSGTHRSKGTVVGTAEHSVPFFWPLSAVLAAQEAAASATSHYLHLLTKAEEIGNPPEPVWFTPNTIRLDLATMRLREFGTAGTGTPMPEKFMLAGWKNMHPDTQYLGKYVTLYKNLENRDYIQRTEKFESWYENPLDLPGAYYLQAIRQLFKDNLFAKGQLKGLGRKLDLKNITCPLYLLAGEDDDITTAEQVLATQSLVGTPPEKIRTEVVPGGHIGLFMGHKTLEQTWPSIGRWILSNE